MRTTLQPSLNWPYLFCGQVNGGNRRTSTYLSLSLPGTGVGQDPRASSPPAPCSCRKGGVEMLHCVTSPMAKALKIYGADEGEVYTLLDMCSPTIAQKVQTQITFPSPSRLLACLQGVWAEGGSPQPCAQRDAQWSTSCLKVKAGVE